MEINRKAAPHSHAKAANIEHQQCYFSETVNRVKVELIRLVVWWRMAWGG